MKILLVEDEDRSARQTSSIIRRISNSCEISVARCRDDAIAEIEQRSFDLVICDLRIPPNNESADVDESHGLAVHGRARELAPGTPLAFLTAFATPKNTKDHLSGGGLENVFGIANFRLVQLIEKDDLMGLEQYLETLLGACESLQSSCTVTGSELDEPMFDRAVRVYAASTGHSRVVVEASSGLSGAAVGRVRLESDIQASAKVLIKLDSHSNSADESERYNKYVANRLQPGHFAPALPPMRAGLRKKSALVLTLADDRYMTLFEFLRQTPGCAAEVVARLRQALQPWSEVTNTIPVDLRDLRQSRISDAELISNGFDANDFGRREARSISMRQGIVHGDLHGGNVLVDSDRRPMIVDYGDVGVDYTAVDPVTLELSLIYNRQGPARAAEFHSSIRWDLWPDVEACYDSSPFRSFAAACRQWALESDSEEAVMAFAYAHSVRQLKYGDVPKEVASAVADASVSAL
ncbi:response regulator [Mycobacterium paragordonae]|nr:response regulator [Mycobacterium paragordonae]